jgi:PIN domain nuclease of toxin-antitoxin system
VSGRRVVLDAPAPLAWVLEGRGVNVVDQMLPVGAAPASAVVETLYRAVEKRHRLPPEQLHEALLEMGPEVEPVTGEDVVRAAELVAASRQAPGGGSLSLGDGLCIAVAERLHLPITGGDEHRETLDLEVRSPRAGAGPSAGPAARCRRRRRRRRAPA